MSERKRVTDVLVRCLLVVSLAVGMTGDADAQERSTTSQTPTSTSTLSTPTQSPTAQMTDGETSQSFTEAETDEARPEVINSYRAAGNYVSEQMQALSRQNREVNAQTLERLYREQRGLAARYAAQLAARTDLNRAEIYYVGNLYHLAGDSAQTVVWLRRFLGEARQTDAPLNHLRPFVLDARRVIAEHFLVIHLVRLKRLPEAEVARAGLRKELGNTVSNHTERLIEAHRTLAAAYAEAGQDAQALPHAQEAFAMARLQLAARLRQNQADERRLIPAAQMERTLATSATELSAIYARLNRTDDRIARLTEARAAIDPQRSTFAYAQVTSSLADALVAAGREGDALKIFDESLIVVRPVVGDEQRYALAQLNNNRLKVALRGSVAPEIEIDEWIGRESVKLSDLRGRVVLLDFWATWCAPCVRKFPQLIQLHEKYEARGLTVLGVTRFYGSAAGGKAADAAEEIRFIKEFKAKHKLPYGVAVAATNANHERYAASRIPTVVLIDRNGRVRYVAVGDEGAAQDAEIERLIKLLLDEPAAQG